MLRKLLSHTVITRVNIASDTNPIQLQLSQFTEQSPLRPGSFSCGLCWGQRCGTRGSWNTRTGRVSDPSGCRQTCDLLLEDTVLTRLLYGNQSQRLGVWSCISSYPGRISDFARPTSAARVWRRKKQVMSEESWGEATGTTRSSSCFHE